MMKIFVYVFALCLFAFQAFGVSLTANAQDEASDLAKKLFKKFHWNVNEPVAAYDFDRYCEKISRASGMTFE